MILIKYTPSNFKNHCPDYHNFNTYDEYKNRYVTTKYFLEKDNHKVVALEFNEDDYLAWIEAENIQDSFLSHQCWAGNSHKGGNTKKPLNCIVCHEPFKGRKDSKFCSSLCRSKNYRKAQKVVRNEKRITEAIEFAKFIGIDNPNDKIIIYINSKENWKREDLLSIHPKHKNYKRLNKEIPRSQKALELRINTCKKIFEELNNTEDLKK